MSYWRLYYHIVWATKNRELLIDREVERIVSRSIRTTLNSTKSIPHAIGIMNDHGHVALSIPPSTAISDVVARLKGSSSHAVNEVISGRGYAWQAEYGVLSFGEKSLPDVVEYVMNRAERHASNSLFNGLERSSSTREPASAGLSATARGVYPRASDVTESGESKAR